MLRVVTDDTSTQSGFLIDEIVREGARPMLAAALEAEVGQDMAELAAEIDECGRRLVVRDGHHRPRTVVTAAGPVEVEAPRINDRRVDEATGERGRFSSKILAPWCRRSPKISEVLPLLYLAEVFPTARHQRCRVHKTRNVMNALPKSAQSGATKAMREIYNAEDRSHTEKAVEEFARTYGTKWPKAVAKITDDRDVLLAFYDFPAEDGIHLRTTNPIESTFSTVKPRTKAARGAGSPAAALAMVFKLVESAQERWRAITGAHLVALVRSGARLKNGVLVERTEVAA
ncbi:transposase [Streptomyces sp. NPDC048290]|uniref:transposase n=1 Tax=Streptomyces sp. NPDC048290 TaxID=3155811 RepID=UPI0034215D14